MIRFAVRALNRLLGVADARLTRASYVAGLEAKLAAEARVCQELRDALAKAAAPQPAPDPARMLEQIGGMLEAKLNDAHVMGYQEASRTTAAYALAHMRGATAFRTPHLPARGDYQARYDLIDHALGRVTVPGLYLEFGVCGGDTINRIARKIGGETVYGFDSFEGLPEDWFYDVVKGTFDLGGREPPVGPNVRLVKGWFQDTLPAFLARHPGPVAFCHVDCDLYSSSKCVLDLLADRIVPGTVLVFDEYFNYPGWEEGEYRAFAEFVRANRVGYRYLSYCPQWYSAAVVIEAVGGRVGVVAA